MSKIKISNKWKKQTEIYKLFASHLSEKCFSLKHAEDMYLYESIGKGDLNNLISGIFVQTQDKESINGYALGKKWLNLTVTMWKEDIKNRLLFKHELYEDDKYPVWWLDSILKKG